mmetsp:Transcript_53000/g.115651  ORF Transcript_53000/g.115651 Transcript_53000/m.115651 type:complete len:170 (-) Transcript_53000:402-911(-)
MHTRTRHRTSAHARTHTRELTLLCARAHTLLLPPLRELELWRQIPSAAVSSSSLILPSTFSQSTKSSRTLPGTAPLAHQAWEARLFHRHLLSPPTPPPSPTSALTRKSIAHHSAHDPHARACACNKRHRRRHFPTAPYARSRGHAAPVLPHSSHTSFTHKSLQPRGYSC